MNSKSTIAQFLTLFTVFFLFFSKKTQAQWQETGAGLPGIVNDLIEHNDVLYAGTHAGLFISTDYGEHWTQHQDFGYNRLVAKFISVGDTLYLTAGVEEGFADYDGLSFFRSTDNGITWDSLSHIARTNASVFAPNHNLAKYQDGYFYAWDDGDYVSEDGIHWNKIPLPPTGNGSGWSFIPEEDYIYATHYEYGLQRTSDYGKNWESLSDSLSLSRHISTIINGVCLGSAYNTQDSVWQRAYSLDYGLSWSIVEMPNDSMNFGMILWGNQGDSLMAWSGKDFYISSDYGQNWSDFDELNEYGEIPYLFAGGYAYRIWNKGLRRFNATTRTWESKINGMHAAYSNLLRSDGNDIYCSAFLAGGYISRDHGATFEPFSDSLITGAFRRITKDKYFFERSGVLYQLHRDGSRRIDTLLTASGSFFISGLTDHYQYVIKKYTDTAYIINTNTLEKSTIQLPAISEAFSGFQLFAFDQKLYLFRKKSSKGWYSDDLGQTWQDGYVNMPTSESRVFQFGDKLLHVTQFAHRWSYDFGKTWQSPVYSDLINSQRNIKNLSKVLLLDNLYIAAFGGGLLASSDSGATWQSFRKGLPPIHLLNILKHRDKLYASLFSAGIWERYANFLSADGLIYLDKNRDTLYNTSDAPLPYISIFSKKSKLYKQSDTMGIFSALIEAAGDTLIPLLNLRHGKAIPPFYVLDSLASRDSVHFAVQLTPNRSDLAIEMTSKGFFNRGFENEIILEASNVGSILQKSVLKLGLDAKMDFMTASPAPSTIQGDTLIWELDTLRSFETIQIRIRARTGAQTMLGDAIRITALITPENSDVFPSDNVAHIESEIVGSFDPNDKQVEPSGNLTSSQIRTGTPLTYTIRFQNTGTFPATFVRIMDTLSEVYDIQTFQMLSSSHPMTWTIENQVLECMFRGIHLPDSSTDWLASQGYVKFKVEPKRTLAEKTEIRNRAGIYFDYNAPIITNYVQNKVQNPIILEPDDGTAPMPLVFFPNPTQDRTQVLIEAGTVSQVHLYDMKGALLHQNKIDEKETLLSFSLRQYGVSIVVFEFHTVNGKISKKVLVL